MGTTQQTDSSNQSNLQFNPQSQSIYDSLTKSGSGVLKGYMDNPFKNQAYTMGLAQSQRGASQAGNNNMQSLLQMMKTSGLGGTAGQGFQAAMQGQTGRANQSLMSQANIGNVMSALQRQMAATGMGMSFSPQLTGQSGTSSQTQTTGGLGTWLPQLLGSAAGMAMGGLTGGASMGMNAAGTGGAFSGGMGSLSSAMNMPSNAFQPFPSQIMQGSGGMNPILASSMGG